MSGVCRPLRDLFKKVPELAIDVQVWSISIHVKEFFLGAERKFFKAVAD